MYVFVFVSADIYIHTHTSKHMHANPPNVYVYACVYALMQCMSVYNVCVYVCMFVHVSVPRCRENFGGPFGFFDVMVFSSASLSMRMLNHKALVDTSSASQIAVSFCVYFLRKVTILPSLAVKIRN